MSFALDSVKEATHAHLPKKARRSLQELLD
ncbi:hypothetical protein RHAB15C_0000569 [Candidatus Rhabdochlamydia porcellionis]|uniref:Uncharacterized protein n=1 Tax=Candidatus Rhabdochlamydia porcellionis TaxID=225148 RepID=A0ABX8Z3P4_9BACT|nr:hypothetical protein RHAB15C_0000569 [Candidatus Rhabdochlamydia porcellionis]